MSKSLRNSPLLSFVALAYAISWACWAPLVLARYGVPGSPPSRYLHLLGALGPALAAIVTARWTGPVALSGLWRRVFAWRTRPAWHLVAWLGPVGLFAVSVVAARSLGGGAYDPSQFGRSTEYPELPRLVYWAASILCYGFGEEVGWRGYALLQLQRRRSAFNATLQLSLIWGLWHLPLFAFAPGLSRMGPAEILGWCFSIVTGAVLFTWLMNSTSSLVIVAVFHGAMDIVFVAPAGPLGANILGALITVWGVVVLTVCGPRFLARRGKLVLDDAGALALVGSANLSSPPALP
jgi:uncharacterized protein